MHTTAFSNKPVTGFLQEKNLRGQKTIDHCFLNNVLLLLLVFLPFFFWKILGRKVVFFFFFLGGGGHQCDYLSLYATTDKNCPNN